MVIHLGTVGSNRRKAITGAIMAGSILASAVAWQYFDERAARPPASAAQDAPVIFDDADSDALSP